MAGNLNRYSTSKFEIIFIFFEKDAVNNPESIRWVVKSKY